MQELGSWGKEQEASTYCWNNPVIFYFKSFQTNTQFYKISNLQLHEGKSKISPDSSSFNLLLFLCILYTLM